MDNFKIDFHDSNLIGMRVEDMRIMLRIHLCNWKQIWYEEGNEKMIEIMVGFDNITNYVWDSEKSGEDIDYDTIIKMDIDEGQVELVLEDEIVSVCKFSFCDCWIQ